MMLTGQVFSIMGNVADDVQVKSITESADKYLYKKDIGGYRLNTDFKEEKFDLGRMFGFAYGEKENGAVFSHMTVMYANALYQRGFVREGYKALYCFVVSKMKSVSTPKLSRSVIASSHRSCRCSCKPQQAPTTSGQEWRCRHRSSHTRTRC